MCKKIPYRIINDELGIASLSISELSEEQRVVIMADFGGNLLASDLIMYYNETRDLIVMNRDNRDYETYLALAQEYLTIEKSTRLRLLDMIPDCVRGFMGKLESILRRREHEG